MVLPGFTGLQLGFTGFYWVLFSYTVFFLGGGVLLGFTDLGETNWRARGRKIDFSLFYPSLFHLLRRSRWEERATTEAEKNGTQTNKKKEKEKENQKKKKKKKKRKERPKNEAGA